MAFLKINNVKVWTQAGFEIQTLEIYLKNLASDQDIDGTDKYWLPPLVELFADFKEPGLEHIYSIKQGVEAMLMGGVGTVVLDPNTNPVADHQEVVQWISSQTRNTSVDILPCGALTENQKGTHLSEMSSMAAEGAKFFSNGVRPMPATPVLRSIFEYSKQLNVEVLLFPWEQDICGKGLVHESELSSILGLQGWPAAAERISVMKCLELAELTQVKLHLRQLTLASSIELVEIYQSKGVDVTFDVNPAHIFRNNKNLLRLDVNDKIIPPLRGVKDQEEMLSLYRQGRIPILSSQHRPVLPEFKIEAFGDSKPGNLSLELCLANFMSQIGNTDQNLHQFIQTHSVNPGLKLGKNSPFDINGNYSGFLWNPKLNQVVLKSSFSGNVYNSSELGNTLNWKIEGYCLNNSFFMPIT